MKRIVGILLTVCMVAALCGCAMTNGKQDTSKANATNFEKVDLNAVVSSVEKKIKNNFKPQIGIVIGSGLGALANEASEQIIRWDILSVLKIIFLPLFPIH